MSPSGERPWPLFKIKLREVDSICWGQGAGLPGDEGRCPQGAVWTYSGQMAYAGGLHADCTATRARNL